eukprot:768484-Hanusia_phi.AAC.2
MNTRAIVPSCLQLLPSINVPGAQAVGEAYPSTKEREATVPTHEEEEEEEEQLSVLKVALNPLPEPTASRTPGRYSSPPATISTFSTPDPQRQADSSTTSCRHCSKLPGSSPGRPTCGKSAGKQHKLSSYLADQLNAHDRRRRLRAGRAHAAAELEETRRGAHEDTGFLRVALALGEDGVGEEGGVAAEDRAEAEVRALHREDTGPAATRRVRGEDGELSRVQLRVHLEEAVGAQRAVDEEILSDGDVGGACRGGGGAGSREDGAVGGAAVDGARGGDGADASFLDDELRLRVVAVAVCGARGRAVLGVGRARADADAVNASLDGGIGGDEAAASAGGASFDHSRRASVHVRGGAAGEVALPGLQDVEERDRPHRVHRKLHVKLAAGGAEDVKGPVDVAEPVDHDGHPVDPALVPRRERLHLCCVERHVEEFLVDPLAVAQEAACAAVVAVRPRRAREAGALSGWTRRARAAGSNAALLGGGADVAGELARWALSAVEGVTKRVEPDAAVDAG